MSVLMLVLVTVTVYMLMIISVAMLVMVELVMSVPVHFEWATFFPSQIFYDLIVFRMFFFVVERFKLISSESSFYSRLFTVLGGFKALPFCNCFVEQIQKVFP